ncbi:MAG: hypothetical protein WAT39_25370 [Planctomycetota bacterium]
MFAALLAWGACVWIALSSSSTIDAPGDPRVDGQPTRPAAGLGPTLSPGTATTLPRTAAGAPFDFAVVPTQAQPVRAMLEAVRRRDVAALAALYSPAIQQRIEKRGWREYAEAVDSVMTLHFGGVAPTAWGYSYRGTAERGAVRLHWPDDGSEANLVVGERRAPVEMRVVHDGDRWLLDEL